MKRLIATMLLAVPALALASIMAASQNAPPSQAYRPGLGDLMSMTVQPRHIRIALAGREANWPLAKYELHQLQEALDRVVQNWPRWKGLPLGGMVEAVEKGPMAALAEAIEAKSAEQFGTAMG